MTDRPGREGAILCCPLCTVESLTNTPHDSLSVPMTARIPTMKRTLAIAGVALLLQSCITPTFAFHPRGSRSTPASHQLAEVLKAHEGQECRVSSDNAYYYVTMNDAPGAPMTRLEFVGSDYIKVSGDKYIPLTAIGYFIGPKR